MGRVPCDRLDPNENRSQWRTSAVSFKHKELSKERVREEKRMLNLVMKDKVII